MLFNLYLFVFLFSFSFLIPLFLIMLVHYFMLTRSFVWHIVLFFQKNAHKRYQGKWHTILYSRVLDDDPNFKGSLNKRITIGQQDISVNDDYDDLNDRLKDNRFNTCGMGRNQNNVWQ